MIATISRRFAVATLLATMIGGSSALAEQRTLTVYSSLVDEDQAKALADGFMAANPDVKIEMINGSTAPIIIARVIAEAANPQADVIMGNAVSALMSADALGLLESYKPANYDAVSPVMRDNRENPVWVGIDAWAASVCYNTVEGEKLGIPAPKSWKDLTQGRIQGPHHHAEPAVLGHGIPCRQWLAHGLRRRGRLEVHGCPSRETSRNTAIPVARPAARQLRARR